MLRLEKCQPGAARHRGGDRDNFLIGSANFASVLPISPNRSGSRPVRFRRYRREFSEAVKFVRLGDGRLVAFAFLGQNVEQHRLVLSFQKFESLDQQRNVVSIDGPVITQSQLFKDHARDEQVFHAFLNLVREMHARSCQRSLRRSGRAFSCKCA